MKKFLLTILLSVLITLSPSFAEEEAITEEDVSTDYETENSVKKFDTEELLNNLLKTAEFFDKQYPKEKINEEKRR